MQTKRKKNAISLFDLLLGLRCEFYRGIIHLSFIRRNEQKKKRLVEILSYVSYAREGENKKEKMKV